MHTPTTSADDLPKVAETALWTAIVRARDAESPKPVCNDTYASRFADAPQTDVVRDLLALERPSVSIPVRHAFIDDVVRGERASLVLVLGAGLDTRAFRLANDERTRFVEVDHGALVDWKEKRLPASAASVSLERIGIDFATETLHARLAHLATESHVLVVAEGLFMYLEPAEVQALLATLRALFPDHTLVGDIMSSRFLDRYARDLLPVIKRHGIDFTFRPPSPVDWLTGAGYDDVVATSVVDLMHASKGRRMPRFMKWLFGELFTGNVVCVAKMRPSSRTS